MACFVKKNKPKVLLLVLVFWSLQFEKNSFWSKRLQLSKAI